MTPQDTAKHQQVREAIMEAIRNGEFAPGQKLPAERDLADRFGVSYMTARRAVTDMVEADLLERRSREGTYVRPQTPRRLSTSTVHLIGPAFDNTISRSFFRLGARAIEAKGWRHHAVRLHSDNVRAGVRALENGLALVMGGGPELQGPLGEALQHAEGRAVLIGNRLDSVGVPSVLADDAQAMRLAVSHLRSAGHESIALIGNHPDYPIDRVQIAAWRACFPNESMKTLDNRLVILNTPRFDSIPDYAYRATRRYLDNDTADTTAFVCLSDEMALAVLAACRDAGCPVPEKMSLVASGDSPLMTFASPSVTCIDVHIEEHIHRALEFLEAAIEGHLDPFDRLRLIEPHIIQRGSVGAPAQDAAAKCSSPQCLAVA